MVDQAVHIGGGHASSASEALTAVEAHAKAWKAGGRRNSDLYDADRLDAVAQTCDDESTLSGDVRDFLAQSRGHLAGRRSARRLGVAIGGVATVIAVVAGVSVAVDDDAGPLSDVGAALERVAALQTTDTTQSAQLAAAVAAAHPDDPRAVAALRDTQSDAVRRDLDTVAARAVSVATTGRAALAGRDGAVRIVDRGAVVATVPAAPGDQTVTAAVDTRGLRLVTSGADGAVRVWSIAGDGSSNPVGALPATGRATTAIALAADRPWAFAADATGAIRVLSLANPARPALLATIPGDGRAVTTLAADPTRAVIATGGPSRPLGVLDVSTPSSPTTIATPGGTAALRGAAFAADGASAVTTDESGSAQLWSVDDTGITPVGAPIDPPSPGGADAAFSPDGTRLAITATSGAIALVDVSRSATPRTLSRTARLTGRGLIASAFTGENELISVTSGAPVAWTLPTGLLTGGFGTPTAASCATTRTYCASGFLRGPVRVFERGSATDIDQIGEIDAPDHFDGASMSPDGRWMMTVDARHLAQLWDVTTIGRPVAVGPARSLGPQQDNHLVFSPDSTRLVTGFGSAQTVRVWRVTARGLVPAGDVTPPQAGAVTAVAFTPDSRGLILGTDADRVVSARLTDTTATVDGPTRTVDGPVTAVAAVGDGVVAGDRLGGLYHFPNDSSRPRSTVDVGNASVGTVLADGPDAVLVAAGDGTLRRWTMGDDMVTLGSPGDPGDTTTGLLRMARTQGSGVLLTGNDGLTRAWDLDAAAARTRLCAAAPALVDPQTPGSCA